VNLLADDLAARAAETSHRMVPVRLAPATGSSRDTQSWPGTWSDWARTSLPSDHNQTGPVAHYGTGTQAINTVSSLADASALISLHQFRFHATPRPSALAAPSAGIHDAKPRLEVLLNPSFPGLDSDAANDQPLEASSGLQIPPEYARWRFEENGGDGLRTWISPSHALDFNPAWLEFAMFDSMDLDFSDRAPGPGESEPQLWRTTLTLGMGTDWQVSRTLAFHAGYRFYDNPMPDGITAGAFPNASHHVTAVSMSLRDGPHSLALIYGLDFLEPANASGISSARQGENLEPLAHLVSFTYNYSF
jgi:hypothetical protein